MAVSAVAVLATTAANVAPIALTEASWADAIHTNASFTASEFAGLNYARSIGAYGTINRILVGSDMGPFTASRTTGQTPQTQTNTQPHNSSGVLGFLPVSAQGVRCARSDKLTNEICNPPETAPEANSFAATSLSQFSVHASTSLLGSSGFGVRSWGSPVMR